MKNQSTNVEKNPYSEHIDGNESKQGQRDTVDQSTTFAKSTYMKQRSESNTLSVGDIAGS